MSAGSQPYLDVANRLGTRLVDGAIWHQDRCTWLGDDLEPTTDGWQLVQRSCQFDLYGGTSGIALFLAHLWKATGESALRHTAAAAMRHALWHARGDPRAGLHQGTAGVAWAAVELGKLLAVGELVAAGGALADTLADVSETPLDDAGADLIAGKSGTLTALLALADSLQRADLAEPCRRLGNGLLADAHRSSFGWSWATTGQPVRDADLCGLAHGASGVAYAMLELHAATGGAEYRIAAEEAARYERGWFDRRHCNWPDLRGSERSGAHDQARPSYPAYWCHGAVGIGLARLRAHALTGDTAALADAGAAIQAARVAAGRALSPPIEAPVGFEANFSLCHGLAGVAELFLFAYEVTGHEAHLEAARRIGDSGAALDAANGHWPCGVPGGGEAPGLMLGLAGIGACYLRMFDPRSMPSVGLVCHDRKRASSAPEQ